MKNPDAIIEEYNGARYSYLEMVSLINAYAAKVDRLSYKGRRCIIVSRQSIEDLKALMFCWNLGMIAVPMSLHYGVDRCQKIINVIQPDLILSDDEGIELTTDAKIYTLDTIPSKFFNSSCENIPDVELMMCTSGTTGMPKAGMFTGIAIKTNVKAISEYFPITNKDTILISRPLYHCAVLVGELLTAIYNGTNILFYSKDYNPIVLSRILGKIDITVMCGTPTILKGIADCFRHQKKEGELKLIALSGEFLLPEYARNIAESFKEAKIFNVYGLTEAGPRVSYLESNRFCSIPQSVGVALNGVEYKIVKEDLSQSKPCSDAKAGEIGRIWVKTPCLMVGYYKDEIKTKERMHHQWFDTGDVGYIDEGFLYVVGRSDDMIIISGVNIYPKEIECKILELAEVKEVLAYGILVDNMEQIAVDVILNEANKELGALKLKELILKQVEGYMMPRRVNIVHDFKRNASGKVIRPVKSVSKGEALLD